MQPNDQVILFTNVEAADVERTMETGYGISDSLRDERVEMIGSNIQERYRTMLNKRNVGIIDGMPRIPRATLRSLSRADGTLLHVVETRQRNRGG
jgi:hypothetical protein